jgi:hypothetical protein
VKLENLKVLEAADQGHQVVVVRLELLLVEDLQLEGVQMGAHGIDVLVEELEILVLREVLEHLLEA